MKKITKFILSTIGIIFLAFLIFWSYFMFFLPHFHEDGNENLVSGNTKLVLVSKMLPDDKSGITVPDSISFWHSIGVVDENRDGRLWTFTDKNKEYVLYVPNTEMPWHWVYQKNTLE